MAQTISLLGATYPDVPAVVLPKDGGGTASFTDVTDTTAAAADVASGKYFYTAAGVRTEGTSSGGGGDTNPVADENDVNFIDFDGTIRYSYSAADFANLTELPANPTHQGLTAQGWNWTLADAKAYVAANKRLIIGQSYITDDGKTRVYISLTEGRQSPMVAIGLNGTATISWGDGSADSTLTGTSVNGKYTSAHTYAKPGKYVISIAVSGRARIIGTTSSSASSYFISADGTTTRAGLNQTYRNSVYKIELGSNFSLSNAPFKDLYYLENITIPQGLAIPSYAFIYCQLLRSATLSAGSSDSVQQAFNGCYALKNVSLTKTTTLSSYAFDSCSGLRNITLPPATALFSYFISSNTMSVLFIPSSVTTIPAYCVTLRGLAELWFCGTSPATVANSNAFSSLPSDCVVFTPYSALAAYLTKTNYPSPSTYTYLGFATYASGATLPTQDTTAAYNVTWYASKAEAIAGTNPITQGNGNEIYCTYVAV